MDFWSSPRWAMNYSLKYFWRRLFPTKLYLTSLRRQNNFKICVVDWIRSYNLSNIFFNSMRFSLVFANAV